MTPTLAAVSCNRVSRRVAVTIISSITSVGESPSTASVARTFACGAAVAAASNNVPPANERGFIDVVIMAASNELTEFE